MKGRKVAYIEEDEDRRRSFPECLSGINAVVKVLPSIDRFMSRPGEAEIADILVAALPSSAKFFLKRLREIKRAHPRLSIIILAANGCDSQVLQLLRRDIIDQVVRPGDPLAIFSSVKSEFAKRDLADENLVHLDNLSRLKLDQSRYIQKALELEDIYDSTLENLMMALDLRDVETFGHSQTVAKYSQVLAEMLGITDKAVLDNIRKGALLHDIGKIAIPDAILKKPGRLSDSEWEKIRLHPALGYGLIKEIKLVREVSNIILYHHERYDGSGYPRGFRKEDIPLEARVFAVADALDAITSHRPYRPQRDFQAAREEIELHSGGQFDPEVVDAFVSLPIEQWEKVRYQTTRILPAAEDFRKLAAKSK